MILRCVHTPKYSRLVYSCKVTGDYTVELCKTCRRTESNDFLIKEEKIQ